MAGEWRSCSLLQGSCSHAHADRCAVPSTARYLQVEPYAERWSRPTVLDNLIASGSILPLVDVMISHINLDDREREMTCNPSFAEFLAQELIPWVRRQYHVTTDAARTVLGGTSVGGLAAAHAGLHHPEIFGKILSQSGAFWWKPDDEIEYEWLTRQFVKSPQLPLSFYIEAGLLEAGGGDEGGVSLLVANRHLRDVLQAKGYSVHHSEFSGAHVFVC
jgi:enterochelin esterase-like enzyme